MSLAALGIEISMHAVKAAPPSVAAVVARGVASPTFKSLSIAKGAVKMIAYAKAKLIGAIAASFILGSASVVVLSGVFARTPAVAETAGNPTVATAMPEATPVGTVATPVRTEIAPALAPTGTTINMDDSPPPVDGGAPGGAFVAGDGRMMAGGVGAVLVTVPLSPTGSNAGYGQSGFGAPRAAAITPGENGGRMGSGAGTLVTNPQSDRPGDDAGQGN
jgi:hypothetical protein